MFNVDELVLLVSENHRMTQLQTVSITMLISRSLTIILLFITTTSNSFTHTTRSLSSSSVKNSIKNHNSYHDASKILWRHYYSCSEQIHLQTTPSALYAIPLSCLENTFLSKSKSSDSFRTCIDSFGHLRSNINSISADASTDENNSIHHDHKPYVLCIAEEDDLPSIAKLTVEAFGSEAITLSSDLNDLELKLLRPGVSIFNAYSYTVAYTEVLSGLRQRMKNRFQNNLHHFSNNHDNDEYSNFIIGPPPIVDTLHQDAEKIAAKSSLILVLAQITPNSNDDDNSNNYNIHESNHGNNRNINNRTSFKIQGDPIATIELRLQPTDAKIPFSEPWFDALERKIAKAFFQSNTTKYTTNENNNTSSTTTTTSLSLQPYVSNLCVAEHVRGRMIGKALVRCVESIVRDSWNMKKIYLHVDLMNAAALNLYTREGYSDVGLRWNPFWAGKAADIGYYVKHL